MDTPRTAILGVGLIGGSIGLALRAAGWPVVGWGPRHESLRLALQLGAIDRIASSAAEAVGAVDLVVLAGPIRSLPDLMVAVARAASPGTVVTDVASVKGQVMRWAAERLPETMHFVGGHPMAGKELQGVGAADAQLLRGCTYCLVPGATAGLPLLERLVAAVGGRALTLSAEDHDRAVAAASHLPFMVATALVQAVTPDLHDLAGMVAASGFADTTRVAMASPAMHADICNFNAPAVAEVIGRFEAALAELKCSLSEPSIEVQFSAAAAERHRWNEARTIARATASRSEPLVSAAAGGTADASR